MIEALLKESIYVVIDSTPGKTLFSFFSIFNSIFSKNMQEIIVIDRFARQLYFYVVCMSIATLLSKMAKLV